MKDISYHILDIVQNSLNAGASSVEISIDEYKGRLNLIITDNGAGMPEKEILKVTDPFYTSSTTKKVGLGLPLLKQNAEATGGKFEIVSIVGKGTTVTAVFNNDHIDMIPNGDIALTIRTLIVSNPSVDFVYRHIRNGEGFRLDTAEIRNSLDGISMDKPEVLDYIVQFIKENLTALNIN